MPKRRRAAVQRYHDRVAGRYDSTYSDAYWNWHDALTWDHLKPHLIGDLSQPVLDLGCGTGKWALRLAQAGWAVTCVDVSAAMLDQARRKFEEAGQERRATFVQADLTDLSMLPAETFALAVALGEPLGCVSSPARALKEVHRLLRTGGVLVASFDNRWAAIDYYLERGDPRELEEFLDTGRTHWLTRDAAEQFPIHTYSPEQLVKLLERAGFEVIDLVGKTVLPMRLYRQWLDESDARRAWMRIEKRLWREPSAIGRAAHLQMVARRPARGREDLPP